MIDRMPFGATGHDSSPRDLRRRGAGDRPKAEADRALELLLEHGVNHIDVAAGYGDAELRIATWLRRTRASSSWRRRPANGAMPRLARRSAGRWIASASSRST